MKLIIPAIFLFMSVAANAQQYDRAIVTDLNFLRRSHLLVNEETFPFYFQHKTFATDVQNEIRILLFEKYGITEVLFFTPDSITYREQSTAWETQAKEYAQGTNRESTLFISIETILQMYTQIEQERTYRFTTRVKAFDHNGRQVYKFKNHIPFVPVYGDAIAGVVDMSEEDFYAFYFDGINYAFTGEKSQVEKRYNVKPMAELYKTFTEGGTKFYLETGSNGYEYGREFNKLSELVYFTINYWSDNHSEPFRFINLATIEFLDGGYHIINRLDEQEYVVRMKGGVNSLKNTYDPLSDITWELLTANGKKRSELVFSGESNLDGNYDGLAISFRWKNAYSCLEVYIDGEMLALVNYSSSSKVLFLSEQISREQLIVITNSIFIYDYASAVRKKIVLRYD